MKCGSHLVRFNHIMTILQLAYSHHHYEGYDCWSVKLTWFATVQRSDLQITSLRSYPSLKRSRQTSQLIRGFVFLSTIFADFWQFFSLLTDLLQLHSYSSLRRSRQTSQLIRGKTWHKIHLKISKESCTNQHYSSSSYDLQLLVSAISVLKKAKPNILND